MDAHHNNLSGVEGCSIGIKGVSGYDVDFLQKSQSSSTAGPKQTARWIRAQIKAATVQFVPY